MKCRLAKDRRHCRLTDAPAEDEDSRASQCDSREAASHEAFRLTKFLTCPSGVGIIDLVGYGTSDSWEDSESFSGPVGRLGIQSRSRRTGLVDSSDGWEARLPFSSPDRARS